jgi:hypothetical protein
MEEYVGLPEREKIQERAEDMHAGVCLQRSTKYLFKFPLMPQAESIKHNKVQA